MTARNRFFQVPHCNGMGHRDPTAHAVMRGVKAEGGWAVVCTEEVEIHPDSDVGGFVEGRLWDDDDMPAHERLVEQVHAHGSLAGIELVAQRHELGEPVRANPAPRACRTCPSRGYEPVQARRMSGRDIDDLRRRHRQAVDRSLRAGYDVVYVYAAHGLTTLQHFLSRRYNDRTDEYGGTLENRARLLREVLEDTRGGLRRAAPRSPAGSSSTSCSAPTASSGGEIEELLGLVGELPDVWDLMVGYWEDDSVTSRFGRRGLDRGATSAA